VAVASKFLAVGSVVPAAVAGIGAVATQAEANVSWKSHALSLLDDGGSASDVLQELLAQDAKSDVRQVGIVDADGRSATHTGHACLDWAGGLAVAGAAIQGNILTGPEVIDEMASAWLRATDLPFPHRLLAALRAGDAAGGDRRGRQSAALFVVRDGAGYGGGDDVAVDLRVDDAADPVAELARLLDLNDLYLTASKDEEKIVVTEELRGELDERARALGHRHFPAWVGTENYEMRVASDTSWIDKRVLDILRAASRERDSANEAAPRS
jgi:uncharacterized Ntn-hydrolase superfamily protein